MPTWVQLLLNKFITKKLISYMNEGIPYEEGQNTEYWLTRHSKSGKGVDDAPGLSQEGVDLARERAKTIAELVNNSVKGSVIFYGGVTSAPRTRSTAEIYVDEVENTLNEEGAEGVRFIKKEEIKEDAEKSGYLATARSIASEADRNPDEKVVIELPLFLKEFSMEKYLCEEDGVTVKPEWQALLDKYGKDYTGAIREWFDNKNGSIDPKQMAEEYLSGMRRLADFSRRFFPNRPLKIGLVGHSFIVDALLTYIANNNEISSEGFDKIGGDVVAETELATIQFDENGSPILNYRGQTFSQEEEEKTAPN